MIEVAIIGVISVFSAYFAQYKQLKILLKISFLVIFIFLALRYDFGNDYQEYLKDFLRINSAFNINRIWEIARFEPGWVFLCTLFRPFGFFAMVAFLALINCFVYYRFIEKYVPNNYYWLSVFIYVFYPSFMLTQASAMRQSLAISIFIFSLNFLCERKTIRYLICACLASTVHFSAIVLIPLCLISLFNWKISRASAICIFILYSSIYFVGKLFKNSLVFLIKTYLSKYEFYLKGTGVEIGTGIGVIFLSVMFALILYYARLQDNENAILFKIAMLSFIIMPFGLILMMIGRIGMYFNIATVAVYPIIFKNLKNQYVKTGILILLICFTMLSFYGFFESGIWKSKFGTYRTIFSAHQNY
jgi:hypothetical protein